MLVHAEFDAAIRWCWDVGKYPTDALLRTIIDYLSMEGITASAYVEDAGRSDEWKSCLYAALVLALCRSESVMGLNPWHDLSPAVRDAITAQLEVLPDKHTNLLVLGQDVLYMKAAMDKLLATFALTTHKKVYRFSAEDLINLLADFSTSPDEVDEIKRAGLLVITNAVGQFARMRFASGALASLLSSRAEKGRLTVFTIPIMGSMGRQAFANKDRDKLELMVEQAVANNTVLLPYLTGPNTKWGLMR